MDESLAIEIEGLTKSYGPVQALRGVDLQVGRGVILGFLGPNGAGKTTTIRCLLDLIRPQAGSMRVLGIDPTEDPVAVRSRVGYLPGELSLQSNLTVEGVLRYLLDLRKRRGDWDHARRLADRLDLDLTMPVRNLSKGNKQKVGLVQALMSRPQLLLLDEPTSGLDPLMQQEIHGLLREARSDGATVFFSSHVIGEVESIAERVAIIRAGVIVEEAEPGRLAGMSVRRIMLRFREPVDTGPLLRLDGVSLVTQDDPAEVTLQVEGEMEEFIRTLAGFPVSDLRTQNVSLEEVFLAHYRAGEEEGG